MSQNRLSILVVMLLVAPLALSACATTPAPQIVTVPVEITRMVEREGQMVTVVETRIVEVTAEPTAQPDEPKVLIVGMAEEPDTLYTFGSFVLASTHVQQAFRDGPIDNRSYSYQPVILEKLPSLEDGDAVLKKVSVTPGEPYVDAAADAVMTATEDMELEQLVVTFKLKPGIKWEDGTPLTAGDSVFGWKLLCDPETPMGKYTCERSAGYEAVDDLTTVWTGLPGYRDPTYFINFETPMPEHVLGELVAAEGAGAVVDSEFSRRPMGWGPFKVAEWEAGQYIRVVRNENYFRAGEGLPYLDQVLFKFIPDSDQLLAQLLSGDVDVATQDALSMDSVPFMLEAEKQGLLKTSFVPTPVWEHIDFNIQPADDRTPFFADVRVRRAVAYGADRQAMVDETLYGQGLLIDSFVTRDHPYYPKEAGAITRYEYDPERAGALLDEAGWQDKDGDGVREAHGVTFEAPAWDFAAGTYGQPRKVTIPDGTPFKVTLNAVEGEPVREPALSIFQKNMADIGIEVEIEYLAPWVFFADGPDGPLFGRRFDLGALPWLTGVEPPCELYMGDQIPDELKAWGGQNETGFVDKAYDEACRAARAEISATKRAVFFGEAQSIFSRDLPVLPLFVQVSVAAARPQVKNLLPDATEYSEMWNIEMIDLDE